MIPPKRSALSVIGVLTFAIVTSASQSKTASVPDDFPLSAWQQGKEVTQIPWTFRVGTPSIRADLRQEVRLAGYIRDDDLRKTGERHDFVMFARALERGNAVTSIYSPPVPNPDPNSLFFGFVNQSASFILQAIVRPGKYRVEVALLDRACGKYNTRFETVTIEGESDPVERAFETFDKVEFVPVSPPPSRDSVAMPPMPVTGPDILAALRKPRPVSLAGSSFGFTPDRPSFLIEKPGTTHISVITITSSPEQAIGNTGVIPLFQSNLSNLLSVVTRLHAPNGTAKLTGVNLEDQTRAFDEVDLKDVTPELLDGAFKKETGIVSLDALARSREQGTFFRDTLKERLLRAQNDNSGARHAIVVVSAASAFQNSSGLTIRRGGDCHCQVFYIRFALFPGERDDIDNILEEYKPQVFEPLTWRDFREDFGKIYAQLR